MCLFHPADLYSHADASKRISFNSLDRRIPTHLFPMMSNHWLSGYAEFCTWVRRVSTFKLLGTGCYRHADGSRRIQFDSPQWPDSNETFCNNPLVIRYATGNDSYFLRHQISLSYLSACENTISSDSTELACLSLAIRRRILSRQIVRWVDRRAW